MRLLVLKLRCSATVSILLFILFQAIQAQHPDTSFRTYSSNYLGTVITRPNKYEWQPSVLYDFDEPNPNRRFKMWWLGQYDERDDDLPPAEHHAADRIYYSESPAPRIVLFAPAHSTPTARGISMRSVRATSILAQSWARVRDCRFQSARIGIAPAESLHAPSPATTNHASRTRAT